MDTKLIDERIEEVERVVLLHGADTTILCKNMLEWSPVNKIDNLNRDFFVLCHD